MCSDSIFGAFRVVVLALLVLPAFNPGSVWPLEDQSKTLPQSRPAPAEWKAPARWRRRFRSTPGTILVNRQEIRFQGNENQSMVWRYRAIQTIFTAPHRLVITGYTNRGWALPGVKAFHFDLKGAMPPAVAALLTERIVKPSQNADPDLHAAAFAILAARHSRLWGGSNGLLRLRNTGIEYVTARPLDSRSWRWADIQTIANPDPFHFRVSGYRETYDFDLKQPISRRVFDRLWDSVYARGVQLNTANGGQGQ
jgi:hypothetical protein